MKRSLLIGATLLFALTAFGCSDDEDPVRADGGDASTDSGAKDSGTTDAGPITPGIDSGTDAGRDSGLDSGTIPDTGVQDAGKPPDASSSTADAGGLDAG